MQHILKLSFVSLLPFCVDALGAVGGGSTTNSTIPQPVNEVYRPKIESIPVPSQNSGVLKGDFSLPRQSQKDLKPELQLAQFSIPSKTAQTKEGKPVQVKTWLPYQYSYGSESEAVYLSNSDLNDDQKDDLGLLIPELNAEITYRPVRWFETTVQVRMAKVFVVIDDNNGYFPGEDAEEINRKISFVFDQAYVKFTDFAGPLELSLGRKNFEDQRHWLYDTSLDTVMVGFKTGYFRTELGVSREFLYDLDLISEEEEGTIDNFLAETYYRGIEDHWISGYFLARDDTSGDEGEPRLIGIRGGGNPTRAVSYWLESGITGGHDEEGKELNGFGFDIGVNYKFSNKFYPNFTLSYAYGSGDDNDEDDKNSNFRQSGLESNEARFSGVSEFKVYGEFLDPELSNLQIFTVGAGFFPSNSATIDFVFHHYTLNAYADELRNSTTTAVIKSGDKRSKMLGTAFDIILGSRKTFGIKRLGIDFRLGWFFPGDAFQIETEDGEFRSADPGTAINCKFWW